MFPGRNCLSFPAKLVDLLVSPEQLFQYAGMLVSPGQALQYAGIESVVHRAMVEDGELRQLGVRIENGLVIVTVRRSTGRRDMQPSTVAVETNLVVERRVL